MIEHDEERLQIFKNSCNSIVRCEGGCNGVSCIDCVFSRCNNGYNIDCNDLFDGYGRPFLLKAAKKFLKGDIGLQDGKLVEFED